MRAHVSPTIVPALGVALLVAACATTTPAPVGKAPDPAPAPSTRPGTAATPPVVGPPVGPERAARVQRSLNMTGFPPEYQRGWRDGCAAVGSATTTAPAGGVAQSVQGWKDGYTYCTKRRPA